MRLPLAVLTLLTGCSTVYLAPSEAPDRMEAELRVPLDRATGKPLLDVSPIDYRSLGYESAGPTTSTLDAGSEVWEVTGRWYDRTPEAGMAWAADSDLTWDEKFAAWVDLMGPTTGDDGHITMELITPFGTTLPAPRLECAEMAMFLRATFASWYGLPYFVTAWHSAVGDLHMGHFGVVDDNGKRVTGYPSYALDYVDHSDSYDGGAWPDDPSLDDRALTVLLDDHNDHLGEGAYTGAYLDEIFLNKRTGHFLMTLLTNAGSMHLASPRNTFDLAPIAIREGDVSVQRWSTTGIGHVVVLKEVDWVDDQLDVSIVYGSMPRIQPKWYDETMATSYLTSRTAGSDEVDGSGTVFSAYGGGLKRWRTPVVLGGRWVNIVPVVDRGDYIGDTDHAALGARVDTIAYLLGAKTPEEQRDALLERIEIARDALRQTPASCANRTRREEAFDELYDLMEAEFGMAREEVDLTYRLLEDHVFAELSYADSKTCCWNGTTEVMYDVVMDYAEAEQADAVDTCLEPTVFRSETTGYTRWSDHAATLGADWKAWSEDEACPQRDVVQDTVMADALSWCEAEVESTEPSPADAVEGCGDLTWEGTCEGDTVQWCEDGYAYSYSCPEHLTCGWDDDEDYNWCL